MNEPEKDFTKFQYNSPTPSLTILKQASFISNTDPNLSMSHTFRCIKKRTPWSEEEDKTMKQLVNKYGTSNWTLISNKMGKLRNGKQCRERWYNQLNPSMKKNNWTLNEENILFSKHMQLGNKWSDIASFLPGRTLNDIKNHFYSKLRKFIRKILKQINDEKLFQINGIDSCKYTGEKIYKMIKKHDITYKNLTKDTIFELIIATEKNPKGKIIFLSEQNGNEINEYNNNESTIDINNINNINNRNILNNFPNNNFLIEESYENYINDKSKTINNNNMNNMINNNSTQNNLMSSFNISNSNNFSNYNFDLTNSNLSNYNFKLKLRKYSNTNNTNEINSLSNYNNINNNIKLIQENKNTKNKNGKKSKQKKDSNIKQNPDTENNNKLIGKKRKKEKKPNNKKTAEKSNEMPELVLSNDTGEEKPKKKRKNSTIKKSKDNSDNILIKEDESNNSLKFLSKSDKTDKINNFNFYPPFNISSPKEIKNIYFPFSVSKSNKSYKPDDFSFSNKYNNYDNLYFLHQKNKNSIISDMSYDNNLLNMNSKNDNTFRNFSINGNYINNTVTQNNLSITNNIEEKTENKKESDKPAIINIEALNQQDFANAFINGNSLEPNDKSQCDNYIYNKNNNNLNIFNPSSPPSVRSCWK